MADVIGVINGSHTPIKSPTMCPESYLNRKSFYSVIFQAVCDHNMSFIDVYAGWQGSVYDSCVFIKSDIYARISANTEQMMPGGVFMLGDLAYPLET